MTGRFASTLSECQVDWRKRLARVLVVSFAGLVLGAGEASAQEAPGAPAGAPAPPLTSPPAPRDEQACRTPSAAQPLSLPTSLPQATLISGSALLPSNAAAKFVFLEPTGSSEKHLRFTMLLTSAEPTGTEHATPLTVLSVVHPPGDLADLPKDAGADAQAAYQVTAQLPDVEGGLITDKTLVVIACALRGDTAANAGYVAVAYSKIPVRLSDRRSAIEIALAVMATVYLVAAILKWASAQASKRRAADLKLRLNGEDSSSPKARISNRRIDLSFRDCLDPVVLSADIFNRASLSQFQILIFLMLVGYGVTYSLLRTGTLSELSGSIVYLLGIPALGGIGSQVTNASRDRFSADNWTWLVSQHVFAFDDPGTERPQWRHLLTSGSNVDLYKLQAMTFTIIVGIAMIYSGFTNLETFKVPDTLLQILGLSQVVFVGGRLTQPATVADADALVTQLRSRANDVRVAATTGIDVDNDGKPLRVADAQAPLNAVASLSDARRFAPNASARYAETASEVEIILKGLTYRDVVTDALKDPFRWWAPTPVRLTSASPGPPPSFT